MSRDPSTLSRRSWLKHSAAAALASVVAGPHRLGAGSVEGAASGPTRSGVAGPIRLTLNENPWGPSPAVGAALRSDLHGLFRYVNQEAETLCEQIAAHEGVRADQVVLGEILEAIGLHLSLQAGPGGEFIYSVPGYPGLVNAAARVGGISVPVPLDADLGNDLAGIAARVTPRTRAIFLINPHNPTGTGHSDRAIRDFVQALPPSVLVILDEAYLEYTSDFSGRTGVRLLREGANVAVFRTFAKVYGMAGLPFGYLLAPKAVAQFLRDQGVGFARDLNRLTLTAAAAALADQGFVAKVRDAVADERERWQADLRALGLRHTTSEANFVFFEVPMAHAAFATRLRERGVEIGRSFPPYDQWVRITIGLPEENTIVREVTKQVVGVERQRAAPST